MSSRLPIRPFVRDDLICRQVDEDFVVYDPISDNTLLLNVSAAVVFELCDGNRTVDEVVAAAARHYSTPPQTLRDDVEVTIRGFFEQGLFAPRD